MAGAIRSIALNSGGTMPCFGLGTFLATQPGEVGAAVKAAVTAGYRLIDCAAGYGNQAEIGEALKEIFAEGTIKREDLFIVSKLFQTHHGMRLVHPPLLSASSLESCPASLASNMGHLVSTLQCGTVTTLAAMRL